MFLLWDFLWLWRRCLPRGIEDSVYREILTCFCEFFSQAIFKYTLLSYQPRDGNLETAGVACQRNTCDNFAMLESCGVILCCSLCYLCIAVCLSGEMPKLRGCCLGCRVPFASAKRLCVWSVRRPEEGQHSRACAHSAAELVGKRNHNCSITAEPVPGQQPKPWKRPPGTCNTSFPR